MTSKVRGLDVSIARRRFLVRAALAAAAGPVLLASITPRVALAHSSGDGESSPASTPSESSSQVGAAGASTPSESSESDSEVSGEESESSSGDVSNGFGVGVLGLDDLSDSARVLAEYGLRTGDLVLSDRPGSSEIFVIDGETKRHVPNIPTLIELLSRFAAAGFSPAWRVIHHSDFRKITTGEPVPEWDPADPDAFNAFIETIAPSLGAVVYVASSGTEGVEESSEGETTNPSASSDSESPSDPSEPSEPSGNGSNSGPGNGTTTGG